MPDNNYDIAILGGGCAALNFAMTFTKSNIEKKIVILEQREYYQHDRNWSFWFKNDDKNFEHKDIIKKIWPYWQFSDESNLVRHQGIYYSYATIAAEAFYKKAEMMIAKDPRISLCMNSTIDNLTIDETTLQYRINVGENIFTARNIIDTRNMNYGSIKNHASFYQIFLGYEIETDEDFFDPQCVDLMKDMICTQDGLSFLYILPFSSRSALVEYTIFTSIFKSPNEFEKKLHAFMNTHYKDHGYKILHTEQAVLPMGEVSFKKETRSNFFHAGGHSGALRESSGYGFLNIYNWSQQAVHALKENKKTPRANQSNNFMNFLDRHFIKTLKLYPHESANIFMAMAKNMPADNFARFMNGDIKFLDILRVIMAVPKGPFLRALWR